MAISKLLLVWLAVSIALVGARADSEAEEVVVEPVHSVSTLKLEIEHLRSQISHLESSISDKAKELKAKDDSISVLEKLVEEKTAAGVAASQTEVESLKVHRAWLPTWRAVQIARFKDLAAKEWNEHGKPTFDGILQKASEKSAQAQSWAEPHLETARTEWIPAVNEKWVTFTTTVSPHVQTLSTKSTEVYEVCRTAITPHFGKVQEFTAPSVQKWIPAVNEKWVTFTTTVSPLVQTLSTKSTEVYEVCRTAITPHFVKVQEFTAPSVQKWIPAVNEKWVTFTTTVSPHVQTLSTKSTKVYEVCRTAITPHFVKVQEFTAPSVQKWIPAVNQKWVTFTTTVSPHVQTLSTKSTEVYEVCRTAITPHFIKVQEFTAPSVQKWIPAVNEKWVTFTTTVSPHVQTLSTKSTGVYEVCRTAITPHFVKVQEFTALAHSVQKWIPAVYEKWVTFTTTVSPHVQTLSTKSTEVYEVCRTAITPHFGKVQEFTASSVQKWIPAVNEKWETFTTAVSPHVQTVSTKSTEVYMVCRTAITPHFVKVQEFIAPYVQKWIPAVNKKWVTFTTAVSPHVQTVSTKSTEVYMVCRTAITPHFVKVQEFIAPYVQKWNPAVNKKWVTFTTAVSPHVQTVSTKSTEVYMVCRTAITPHFVKVQEFIAPYVQKWIPAVNKKWVTFTTAVSPHVQTVSTKSTEVCRTAITPHFVKVQEFIAPYVQIQDTVLEKLKSNEYTKPLATKERVWFMASALLAFPNFLLYRIFSTMFCKKTKKPSHAHASNAHCGPAC